MYLARESSCRLLGSHANRLACTDVHECSRHLAPIAKLQGTLPQAAASDDGNSVSGATVDFDEGDEALAVFTARIINAQFLQPEHCHAHTENLPRAKVAMGLLGVMKIFIEGFHGASACRTYSRVILSQTTDLCPYMLTSAPSERRLSSSRP